MNRAWGKVVSSAVFRLVVIILAVVIPLNLLTLVLGSTVIAEVERQVSLETQGALQLYMGQLDNAAYRIGTKLYLFARRDEDFSRLHEKEITDDEEYYRQMQSTARLRNTMETILEDNSLISGLFAYFPEKDYFIQQGGSANQRTLHTFVSEIIDTDDYAGWHIIDADGDSFLILIHNFRHAYCGALISLNTLAQHVNLYDNAGGVFQAFTDRSGFIYQANNGEPKQIELDTPSQKVNGVNCTVVWAQSERTDLCYVRVIPKSQMADTLPVEIRLLQVLSVLSVLVIPVIAVAMRRWIARPVGLLTSAMERIEQGDVDYRIPQSDAGSDFDQINSHFNRMMDEVSDLKISMYEQQLKTDKIRLGFLSQQIQPHFILNALNILYSYEPEEYQLTQKMILCLSKYFRYVVNANEDFVELGQELLHIQNYFEIQQARFLRAFCAEVEYDECLEHCLIPPLIVQNFAENAIKYALVPGEKVSITVKVRAEGDMLYIAIYDTGAGISDEVLERIAEFRKTREFRRDLGVGIQNAIDRLEIIYGEQAELSISRQSPRGTQVNIQFPIKKRTS